MEDIEKDEDKAEEKEKEGYLFFQIFRREEEGEEGSPG